MNSFPGLIFAALPLDPLAALIAAEPKLADPLRPQFHYTAERGFISDPNGLVFYKGEYHLFHQYNPKDCKSGVRQHWGHAIGTDLVHWTPQPIAPELRSGKEEVEVMLRVPNDSSPVYGIYECRMMKK